MLESDERLGPSVIPEEGLDDSSVVKALIVGAVGAFIGGIIFAVVVAILGKNFLKKINKH